MTELISIGLVISRIASLALLSGTVTATVAFVYRLYVRADFPESASVIVGLGTVAVYLNTRLALSQFIGGETNPLALEVAIQNSAIFGLSAVAAFGGRSIGHRLADSEQLQWAGVQPSIGQIVRATGRVITVRLPDTVRDIEGYDPVDSETKGRLVGERLDFQKGLTVEELAEAIQERVKEKYDVGYVDLDLDPDGTLSYLAVGQRPAGLSKTIPPGSAAAAINADPPYSASPGDTVEIWPPDADSPMGEGELRARIDDTVTIVADRQVCERLDPNLSYRLVTHPEDPDAERSFAAILRRHDETIANGTVGNDSPLVGSSIASITGIVLGIERDGELISLPTREYVFEPQDTLYLLARPEELRRLTLSGGISLNGADRKHRPVGVHTQW